MTPKWSPQGISLIIFITPLLPALQQHKHFLAGVLNNGVDLDIVLVVSKGVFQLLADPFDPVESECD